MSQWLGERRNPRKKEEKEEEKKEEEKKEEGHPSVFELSSDDDDAMQPPRGLYVWINDENTTIENVLCGNQTRKRYLAQSKGVQNKCTKEMFDNLEKQVTCSNADTVRSCIRKLLSHLHPDKLDSKNKECGTAMFQELSEAHTELKHRPTFNEHAHCS